MKNADKPAYPTNARMHSDAQGLTKREMFAMAAMQGFLSNSNYNYKAAGFGKDMSRDRVVEIAIQYADELLRQLEV